MSKLRIMSNQGQGLLSHVYLGFVCCVLIRVPDIRLAFTGPLVLWFATLDLYMNIQIFFFHMTIYENVRI